MRAVYSTARSELVFSTRYSVLGTQYFTLHTENFTLPIPMPFTYEYPRPAVSADVVVLDQQKKQILLIQRLKDPFAGSWALPGGFMEMDESADQCAIRELQEETGLLVDAVKQIGAYSALNRDPRGRVVTVAFLAFADKTSEVQAADDAADVQWFDLAELPPLAFDHAKIIADAIE